MEQRQTYLITVNTEELLPGISERLETLLIDKDAYTKQFYRDIIKYKKWLWICFYRKQL